MFKFDADKAEELKKTLPDCDCLRFSDGFWYKFTKTGITKEQAINVICSVCGLKLADIIIGRNDEDGIAEYVEKEILKVDGGA